MLSRGILVAGALVCAGMFGAAAHAEDAAPAAGAYKVDLPDDTAKLSYALGQQFGDSLKSSGISKDILNMDLFLKGFNDMLDGKRGMEDKDRKDAIRTGLTKAMDAAGEKNATAGKAFLADNAKKDGVKTTASGLQYKVIKDGTGKTPKATDTVKTRYRGTLIDGKEFDSSYKRGEPAEFPVNGVIKGWTEALQLMGVGSKWRLTIPSDLAYGANGQRKIGPNSTLLFDIELIGIKETPKSPVEKK